MKNVKKRVGEYEGYIDLNYKKTKDDLVCEFYVEPAKGITFESAAQRATSESSIGTWTDIGTMSPALFKKIAPKIFYLNKKTGIYKVAYDKDLFEELNISQIMSAVAGNLFGMSDVKNIKLMDIDFPDCFMVHYKGPRYGIHGVRKMMKVKDRPLVGTIVKPKVGLNEVKHASVAYESWLGGCDVVKDDENLTSMKFNHFDKRIKETLKLKRRAEKQTGEKKAYLANVTAPYPEMVRRAKEVIKHGGEFAMVDVLTVGWSGVQALLDLDLKLIWHGHRAMHAAFTRNPKHGISMLVIAKLCRLMGIDQLHIGGIVGKMYEGKQEVTMVGEEIEEQIISEDIFRHRLQEDWHDLKPMFAVCSGGLDPTKISPLVHAMGRDIIVQAGGGIHGHPGGTYAGAKAMRQAVEAEMYGITAAGYAKNHSELAEAIKKWKNVKR